MGDNPEIVGKGDEPKEQKVVLFGILSATKALLNPIKESLEIGKQNLETLARMDKSLDKISVSIAEVSINLLRAAEAIEKLKSD
jgi:hypothetical protein